MLRCIALRCVGYGYGGPAIEVVDEEEMREELAALKKRNGLRGWGLIDLLPIWGAELSSLGRVFVRLFVALRVECSW